MSVVVFQEMRRSSYGYSCNEVRGMKFMIAWCERAPDITLVRLAPAKRRCSRHSRRSWAV